MSGQDAIRGFAVQTLICLLDALRIGVPEWRFVTIEPDIAGDKVDILWEYDNDKLAQQVKSSKNQIGRAAVETWCEELSQSGSADRYQLILAGPIAAAVLEHSPFHGVSVPTPTSMDTLALIDQAVTKLDRYLLAKAFPLIPLPMREAMVSLIAARLIDGSIRADRVSREVFDGWLQEWILVAYPAAVEQRLSANCDVLWSNIQIAGPQMLGNQAFDIVLPLSVINGGLSVAVVEWFLLRVNTANRRMLYRSEMMLPSIDSAGEDFRLMSVPFSEFAVNPGNAQAVRVLFVPVDKVGFDNGLWPLGDHDFELWVKYAAVPDPRQVKKVSVPISIDHRSVLSSAQTKTIRISTLRSFIEKI
ncbi:hypothetical protein [Agrobacterium vitis]|uniref:Uncharacterized protein n=1 Tax=Agrobacterium vitis TaxID=373 RepID=A0AAE2R817_AGRVI|nr:hypothetical protein [Agrobacterium vitis]MBF2713203.1 hypothetical protein [Agrobacterium vitis]